MSDTPPYRMLCPCCQGVGKRRAAHSAVDPDRNGVTLVHLVECGTCDGTGWTNPGLIPPA